MAEQSPEERLLSGREKMAEANKALLAAMVLRDEATIVVAEAKLAGAETAFSPSQHFAATANFRTRAIEMGLDPETAINVIETLMSHSVRQQICLGVPPGIPAPTEADFRRPY